MGGTLSRTNVPLTGFNQGIVSKLALARVDLERLRFAAEIQTNYTPRTSGPMSLRVGTKYIATTLSNNLTKPIAFIYSPTDIAMIEVVGASSVLRVRVLTDSTESLVTRVSVSTSITNGDFSSATGWTLSGGASISGGALQLEPSSIGTKAACYRSVSVSAGDTAKVHAIRIVVATNGPVGFRIGSTAGDDDILSLTYLEVGTHSLAFVPGATTVYVQYESSAVAPVIVTTGTIESSGTMQLPIPWAAADLNDLKFTQTGQRVFVGCAGFKPRVIERRAAESWSIVEYRTTDGPFKLLPSVNSLITPSATTGGITLTSAYPIFEDDHVGSLMRLFQSSQVRSASLTTEDTYTSTVRITGVEEGGGRNYIVTVSGTYTGVLSVQRSFDGPDSGFVTVSTYADAFTGTVGAADSFDNAIVWYRVGFELQTPDPTGTAVITLSYQGGGGVGIVRITEVASATSATAYVLSELASTTATRDWREGEWSAKYGYPTTPALFEGRLWWFGEDRIWGSVSDDYYSFDEDFEGDAGPINRTIGYGPIDSVQWALPLNRLILGLGGSEASIRSGGFDNPLTPTDFAVKDASTQGSANVPAVKVDSRGIFVQRSERRVYQLLYSSEVNDYVSSDLTALLPDIDTDIVGLAVQRQPDTRVYAICEDGSALVLLFEPMEEVVGWYKIESTAASGLIEDICVVPGNEEDAVFFFMKRTISGGTVRYIERAALESNCTGLPVSHLADAHVLYSSMGTTTLTGLSHVEGEKVVVWGWDDDDTAGTDLTVYTDGAHTGPTVSSGAVTASAQYDNYCVGLPYTAQFKSAKLAYGARLGTALTQKKRVVSVGVILHNTHTQGVSLGDDFDHLEPLPLSYQGTAISSNTVYEEYDEASQVAGGRWSSDSRLCLQSAAPRPATILGAVIGLDTHEK